MKYVYGPIPSRRLGRSLGVDPIPLKTCNWNCVYCQLGRTSPLINERREWAPRAEIVGEVRAATSTHLPGAIDYISFVGSGEPTLHSGLGWMVRAIKAFTALPVAVITNGARMGDAEVRADLLAADVVMPTLSAGSEELFRLIHRPHPDLTLAVMLAGLEAFRADFGGQLWVEVMLIAGLNDDEATLHALAAAIARVRPDQVHLVLPDRPATEPWVEAPNAEGIMRAMALLGSAAHVVPPSGGALELGKLEGFATVEEALLAVLQRHPISEEQLAQTLAQTTSLAPVDAAMIPLRLEASGRVRRVTRHGVRFWTTEEQLFAANGKDQAAASITPR